MCKSSVWGEKDGMSTLSSLLLEEEVDIVWGVPFQRISVHVFKYFLEFSTSYVGINEYSISITSVGEKLTSLLSDGRVNVFWNVISKRIPVKVVTQLLVLNKS